jgi:hypothetical protein
MTTTDLVGALEAVSGIELPHRCRARVVATATVTAADVTATRPGATRATTVLDDAALTALVGADTMTTALRARLREVLAETAPRTDVPPDELRELLAVRGRLLADDEAARVTWQRIDVDVVELSHGPADTPLLVLASRKPLRWLGTVERLVPSAAAEGWVRRAWRRLRAGSWPRVFALAAVVVLAVVGTVAVVSGSGHDGSLGDPLTYRPRERRNEVLLVMWAVTLALAAVWNPRSIKATACSCRRCEARRARGALLVRSGDDTVGRRPASGVKEGGR